MRTKIWGRKKWELLALLLCLSTWLCFCSTCEYQICRELLKRNPLQHWNIYALLTTLSLILYIKQVTCLGLAPPRRTSNKVAHKLSVSENLNNLSDMAKKIGCILKLIFLWLSEADLDLPTARLKNFGPFFSDGRPTKSLPRNCKPSNLTGSNSLQ